MKQLIVRTLVLAGVLALVLIVTLIMSRHLIDAEAAETDGRDICEIDQPLSPVPFDPAMHAFFVSYLNTRWELKLADASSLAGWVLTYSSHYDTDPMVQLARVLKESSGRHYRRNKQRDKSTVVRGRGREIGFSQIMPSWAGKQVEDITITRDMLFDPEGNIHAGIALYKRYEEGAASHLLALARYNRPGSRRPNSYARAVDRLYREIQREHAKFLVCQPENYTMAIKRLGHENSQAAAVEPIPDLYF